MGNGKWRCETMGNGDVRSTWRIKRKERQKTKKRPLTQHQHWKCETWYRAAKHLRHSSLHHHRHQRLIDVRIVDHYLHQQDFACFLYPVELEFGWTKDSANQATTATSNTGSTKKKDKDKKITWGGRAGASPNLAM